MKKIFLTTLIATVISLAVMCCKNTKENSIPAIKDNNITTVEVVENELSKTLDRSAGLILSPFLNIHVSKRFLFMPTDDEKVKITWDEHYSNVKVIPISYLISKESWFTDFIISSDGNWATTFVGKYIKRYKQGLYKRAFVHLDERYPNGISTPVIIGDYEDYHWDSGAFVEHPVHGMCFAEEWHKEEGKKNQLYLRLYKMSDVLAQINRQE